MVTQPAPPDDIMKRDWLLVVRPEPGTHKGIEIDKIQSF